jgi:hypothetical protein
MIEFIRKLNEKPLEIKYRFRGYEYLVADAKGNFYVLEHCPNKRTIPFKKLDKSKGYVYYHGAKKYLTQLKNKII